MKTLAGSGRLMEIRAQDVDKLEDIFSKITDVDDDGVITYSIPTWLQNLKQHTSDQSSTPA